jgi:sugar lactone lactonase YvrE
MVCESHDLEGKAGPAGTEICVNGLAFPEGGPDFASDGTVAFVELYSGQVTGWNPIDRQVFRIADTGGGPNSVAAAGGRHGAEWLVTQNGGAAGPWRSPNRREPGIQRIANDGTVSYLCTSVDGRQLVAPNDLCLDDEGTLFFTDPCEPFNPASRNEEGYIFAVRADGVEVSWNVGCTFPNGIAWTGSEILWTESYSCRVMRFYHGRREMVAQLPLSQVPDGLAVRPDGLIAVTTTKSGGLILIWPDGRQRFLHLGNDVYSTNCNFDQNCNLYVTDAADLSSEAPSGRLWRIESSAIDEVAVRGQEPL